METLGSVDGLRGGTWIHADGQVCLRLGHLLVSRLPQTSLLTAKTRLLEVRQLKHKRPLAMAPTLGREGWRLALLMSAVAIGPPPFFGVQITTPDSLRPRPCPHM